MNSRVLLALALALGGCVRSPQPAAPQPAAPQPAAPQPAAPQPAAPQPAAPKAPLVPKLQVADWCPEHAVPESLCTRCNEALIAGFKAKQDWCEKHVLPDSQCLVCHPELEAKFRALAPKPEGPK